MIQFVALGYILGCLNPAQAADPEFICPTVVSHAIPPVVNSSVYSYAVSISIKSMYIYIYIYICHIYVVPNSLIIFLH